MYDKHKPKMITNKKRFLLRQVRDQGHKWEA